MKSLLISVVLAGIVCTSLGAQEASQLTPEQDALMESAYLGQLDEVKRLVAAGTAVDFADSEKRTPFMLAAFNGHTPVLEYLREEGVAVDAKDSNGRTALMYASSGPFEPAVEFLLKAGAEVDVQGALEGFTALMTAASEGLAGNVRLLLTHGADPSLVDKDGDTAASFARQNGHAEVVELLENPPAPDQ